jgi:hypothetical protein
LGGCPAALGDDATAGWYNPAGLAAQRSQVAISYQSFVIHEFHQNKHQPGNWPIPGAATTEFHDPALLPSFAGAILALGDSKTRHAISLCYIHPGPLMQTWYNDISFIAGVLEARQSIRLAYAHEFQILKKGAGLCPKIAVGAALDWVSTTYETLGNTYADVDEEQSGVGFGGGILLTVYSDGKSVSVDAGFSANSGVDFDFDFDESTFPAYNAPATYAFGIAAHVHGLTVSTSVQIVGWGEAVESSRRPGMKSFEDAVNFGVGAEYSVPVGTIFRVVPRLGVRFYHTPWPEKVPGDFTFGISGTTAVNEFALSIDTHATMYVLYAFGVGVRWALKGSVHGGFDFAIELGADETTWAAGFSVGY